MHMSVLQVESIESIQLRFMTVAAQRISVQMQVWSIISRAASMCAYITCARSNFDCGMWQQSYVHFELADSAQVQMGEQGHTLVCHTCQAGATSVSWTARSMGDILNQNCQVNASDSMSRRSAIWKLNCIFEGKTPEEPLSAAARGAKVSWMEAPPISTTPIYKNSRNVKAGAGVIKGREQRLSKDNIAHTAQSWLYDGPNNQ